MEIDFEKIIVFREIKPITYSFTLITQKNLTLNKLLKRKDLKKTEIKGTVIIELIKENSKRQKEIQEKKKINFTLLRELNSIEEMLLYWEMKIPLTERYSILHTFNFKNVRVYIWLNKYKGLDNKHLKFERGDISEYM
jgi:hypothetical protein